MSHPSGPYAAEPGPPPGRRPAQGGPHPSAETRRDAEAALAARSELGPEYEQEIAAGLAERMEELAAYRMAELRHQAAQQTSQEELERVGQRHRFVLGIVSLSVGIPITGIAASDVEPGLLGVAVAWAGIVGVNLAAAWRGRRHG